MLVQSFQIYHLPYNVNIQPLTLIIIILYLMHFLFYLEKINKIIFKKKFILILTKNFFLRLGTMAIASPQIISNDPTTLLYHLLGTLKSNVPDNGNTFAYFTYSFLWKYNSIIR